MIIKYPTGLYSTAIPRRPEDSGNVTFTISNSPPPRTDLVYPKVPLGIAASRRDLPTIDYEQRRQSFGQLIFTIVGSNQTIVGTGGRQHEIGQILEFGEVSPSVVDTMYVAPVTETRHDTNVFDYDTLGASDDEQAILAQQSLKAYQRLADRINTIRSARADAELEINTQQKIINESERNITAVQVIIDTSDETTTELDELLQKLQSRKARAVAALDAAIIVANQLAAEATATQNQLQAVAVVVK